METTLPKIYKHDETVISDEQGCCADCERDGYVSSWPGNDPANRGSTVLVLCTSAQDGRLVCDDCEEIREGIDDESEEVNTLCNVCGSYDTCCDDGLGGDWSYCKKHCPIDHGSQPEGRVYYPQG